MLTPSAVLVPLVEKEKGKWSLFFTQRSEFVEHHKGQICFPGGVFDPEDQDLKQTALREVYEELGWRSDKIEIIHELTQVTTPSGFSIIPYVAKITDWDHLNVSEQEISRCFTISISELQDPTRFRVEKHEWRGESHEVPFFEYEDALIWGVTGRILQDFLKKISDPFLLSRFLETIPKGDPHS